MADAAWSDLARRVASGIVMAVAALGAAWLGGWIFTAFWLIAALGVLAEWQGMVLRQRPPVLMAAGGGAILLAALAATLAMPLTALAIVVIGAVIVTALAWRMPHAVTSGAGVAYAGAMVVPAVLLRADPGYGMVAVFCVFAAVWGSDIMAYFTGRTLGGPKLWPSVSPKKTWSGFVGGTLCGAIAAWLVASLAGAGSSIMLVLGIVLAIVSQGGDLAESALKRRFDTKDTSSLIPGHGGVMDRLDGFVAAVTAAFVIGALHDAAWPASGLVIW